MVRPAERSERLGHTIVWPEAQPDKWVRLYVVAGGLGLTLLSVGRGAGGEFP